MPKIFVTGGSGYLGSTFLPYIPQHWEVISFDLREPKVELPKNSIFVKGSITDDLSSDLLKDADVVLHLAAVKGSEQCSLDPMKTIEVNILGTHNLLKAAILNNVKMFIFASTYRVYDISTNLPFTEKTPVRPTELYGLSKVISEIEIATSEIDYVILRFANIFGLGSGVGAEEVIFNFIKKAFDDKPIVLHNGGTQKLDFIDVEDVCKCLLKVIENPKISKCTLNVGSGQPRSVASAAHTIHDIFQREFKKTISITSSSTGAERIPDRWVSISKLEEKIGKLDLKPFEQSIESFILEYRRRRFL